MKGKGQFGPAVSVQELFYLFYELFVNNQLNGFTNYLDSSGQFVSTNYLSCKSQIIEFLNGIETTSTPQYLISTLSTGLPMTIMMMLPITPLEANSLYAEQTTNDTL